MSIENVEVKKCLQQWTGNDLERICRKIQIKKNAKFTSMILLGSFVFTRNAN